MVGGNDLTLTLWHSEVLLHLAKHSGTERKDMKSTKERRKREFNVGDREAVIVDGISTLREKKALYTKTKGVSIAKNSVQCSRL